MRERTCLFTGHRDIPEQDFAEIKKEDESGNYFSYRERHNLLRRRRSERVRHDCRRNGFGTEKGLSANQIDIGLALS